MLLSVTVCFILLYRQVIVSFFASVKTGVSIQLVAIATFFFATRNTLLDFSATAQNEIGFPIRVGRFIGDLVCVMTGCYCPHPHDRVVFLDMLCYLYWYCFK